MDINKLDDDTKKFIGELGINIIKFIDELDDEKEQKMANNPEMKLLGLFFLIY